MQFPALNDTIYMGFGANLTTGSGADGSTPVFTVRERGASASAAATLVGTPTLLTSTDYSDGSYEIAIAVTAGNGFAVNTKYGVYCTLLVDSQNPTGYVGEFQTSPVQAQLAAGVVHGGTDATMVMVAPAASNLPGGSFAGDGTAHGLVGQGGQGDGAAGIAGLGGGNVGAFTSGAGLLTQGGGFSGDGHTCLGNNFGNGQTIQGGLGGGIGQAVNGHVGNSAVQLQGDGAPDLNCTGSHSIAAYLEGYATPTFVGPAVQTDWAQQISTAPFAITGGIGKALLDDLGALLTATNAGGVASKTADAGAVITGTNTSGDYTNTFTKDSSYWITAPVTPAVSGFGLRQNLVFNLPLGRVPTQIQIWAYFHGTGRVADVYALNTRTGIYDKLTNTSTDLPSLNAEHLYAITLPRDYADDTGGSFNVVTLEFRSASTTTGDRLRLDQVLIYHVDEAATFSASAAITAEDVWTYPDRELTSPGVEPVAFPPHFSALGITAGGAISEVVQTDSLTGYVAPANADIAAIKVKTDLLTFTGTRLLTGDRLQKNTALADFPVPMELLDGTPATGKTVSGAVSLDGAPEVALTNSASITEVGTTGSYHIDLVAGDMNGNTVSLRFSATGCKDTKIFIVTQP